MKIFVLGSKGMLGRYVAKYLKITHEVVELNRASIDAANISKEELELKLKVWGIAKGDVIINCMGTIKPKVSEHGELDTILINSVFPRLLADIAEVHGAHLIHPTTDCVFSGLEGGYTELSPVDVNDIYGLSKALGEPHNATVIRTSIIGEEVGQARSLVEWIKSNKNKTVEGYTNHNWNGITCLEFARICGTIIETNWYWKGVRHIYGESLSKAALVDMVNLIYGLNIIITPNRTPVKCDRTLSTNHPECNELRISSLYQQIQEMHKFSGILYS